MPEWLTQFIDSFLDYWPQIAIGYAVALWPGQVVTGWVANFSHDKAKSAVKKHVNDLRDKLATNNSNPVDNEKIKKAIGLWDLQDEYVLRNKSQSMWTGIFERLIFTTLVALWAPGFSVAFFAYVAAKMLTGWNRIPATDSNGSGALGMRWIGFASLNANLVSFGFALLGGLIIRGFNIPSFQ